MKMVYPPNKTLFIANLPTNVPKADLRKTLIAVFRSYGPLYDVYTSNKRHLRSQAFVCFEQLKHAITAKTQLQSFPVYGNPIRIGFAKNESLRNEAKQTKKKKSNSPAETVVSLSRLEPEASNVLYVRRLPKHMTPSELSAMFTHLPGFNEIRHVPNRSDMVFVEFKSVEDSTAAKKHLMAVKLPGISRDIQVEYARS